MSATDFDVAGRTVTTTATTRYENGTAADLALNVKVEAEGAIDAAGVLVATKIQFKRGNNAGLAGVVDNVTADSSGLGGTLTVLGVTITVDNNTRIEDKSDARLEILPPGRMCQVGDYVRVRGTENGALKLTASRLERRRVESTLVGARHRARPGAAEHDGAGRAGDHLRHHACSRNSPPRTSSPMRRAGS